MFYIWLYYIVFNKQNKKPEIYIIYIYIYRTEKQSVKKNKIYSVIFMILYLLVETETDKRLIKIKTDKTGHKIYINYIYKKY